MENPDVQLQDSLRSLAATEDIHTLPTDPSLTSRITNDFEAAAAVAAANAASGSQPFINNVLPAATAAAANMHHGHQSPVAGQAGEISLSIHTQIRCTTTTNHPSHIIKRSGSRINNYLHCYFLRQPQNLTNSFCL